MAEGKDQHEPSVEEILASIRRIIAEDGEPTPEVTNALPLRSAGEEDILELTEMLAEDGSVVRITGPAEPAPPISVTAAPGEVIASPPPAKALPPEKKVEAGPRRPEDLLSASSAAAAVAALAQLVGLDTTSGDARSSPPPPPSPLTVEALVRDLLRPLLASWLDQNLPSLVERVVREELARLARNAKPH